MSNIAGKAYAMNVVTPVKGWYAWQTKFIFWFVVKFPSFLKGLINLSLIHYAHWAVVSPKQFPRLSESQPKESLNYHYMFFFSNFNGSWSQYVDSFSFAIPSGLDIFWRKNIGYPKSVPLTPFHDYIRFNQVQTSHYYSAYPYAASNDVKSAAKVKDALLAFEREFLEVDENTFADAYNRLLIDLQNDMGELGPVPIVSMASDAVINNRSSRPTAIANEVEEV
ncbi:Uncharacterised protein [BD1-7 clade bacterium]|uniref:Uncharacterized protein n=1 Tax=BD1-7 clade bacterium TaxID=2029982 RepID=A0A5S9QZF7_9GAMM|nr:Uncharacterised protein [BD1-7 clade bacterium]